MLRIPKIYAILFFLLTEHCFPIIICYHALQFLFIYLSLRYFKTENFLSFVHGKMLFSNITAIGVFINENVFSPYTQYNYTWLNLVECIFHFYIYYILMKYAPGNPAYVSTLLNFKIWKLRSFGTYCLNHQFLDSFINESYIVVFSLCFVLIFVYIVRFVHCSCDTLPHNTQQLQTFDITEKQYRRIQFKKNQKSNKQNSQKIKRKIAKDLKLQSLDIDISQVDWIMKLIEDSTVFLRMLKQSKSNSDFGFAAITFVKLRTDQPLLRAKYLQSLIEYCTQMFEDEHELQSFDFNFCLDSTSEYLDKYSKVRDAPVFKKLYKCLMYALSFSICDKIGITFDKLNYTKLEAEAIRCKFASRSDMAHCFIDTIVFILKRGRAIMHTGNVDVIFHSGKTYDEWSVQVDRLITQSKMLGHPDISGVNSADFLAELDDSIEKGECISRYSDVMTSYEKKFFRSTLNTLKMIRFDHVSKRKAKESRDIPFSVLVYSPPKMGKSSIMHNLRVHYAKLRGLRPEKEAVFTRNPIADHWDGYDNSYWGCIFDDVAFLNPKNCMGPDPSIAEFLQAINGESYITKQAELENKGTIGFKSEWCVATTNTIDLNAHAYFACPSAVQRRFPFIVIPKVKPEYQDENGCLDSTKLNPPEHYYDYWTWTVKVVKSRTLERELHYKADLQILFEDKDLRYFLKWYTKAIEDHRRVQEQIRESGKKLNSIILCDNCKLPQSMCECEIQSIDKIALLSNFIFGYFITQLCVIVYFIVQCLPFLRTWYQRYNFVFNLCQLVDRWLDRNFTRYFRRRFWTDMGERIGRSIPGYKLAIPFIAGLSIGAAVFQITRICYSLQGHDVSTNKGNAPKPDGENGRENVWYKNDYNLTTFDVNAMTTSLKNMSDDDFVKLISHNLVSLNFERGTGIKRLSRAICVTGQIYLTNNHCVPEEEEQTVTVILDNASQGVNRNLKIKVSSSQIFRFPDRDICFIKLTNLPPRKNIVRLFPNVGMNAIMNGFYVKREVSGAVVRNQIQRIVRQNDFLIKPLSVMLDTWMGVSTDITVVGDCGSTLIGRSGLGPVILGLHVLGSTNSVVAIKVDKEFIQDFLESNNFLTQCGEPQLSAPSKEVAVGDLHKKSTVRYIDDGTANVYGSLSGFRGKHKSAVGLTPMAHYLSEKGYKIKFSKPEMSSWEPWRIAALDMVKPVSNVNENILNECIDAFKQDILSKLSKERLKQVEIYDDFTAINGAAGVAYVDKMNRSTSTGNPWKTCKKYFMEAAPAQHGLQDPVHVDDEIMNRVKHIISEYEDDNTVMPNFCAHLKDEPVSFKKAKMKKTRVFTGAPFDWSIVVRKYLLSIVRVMQNERYIFEAAPGTVAQSQEWGIMYNYLTQHGKDRMVAGDYKAFDKKMPPQIILAAFDIIYELCRQSGNYSDLDLKVVMGIAYDTAFPMIDFNGDLIQFYGSNPSGHPLTVIINSLANSLYIRYAYRIMNPNKEVTSFKKNVALITYGDDNAMGIKRGCDWFNHTSIQEALAQIDVVYTMADKEAESIPYIHIDQVSFLKRCWRYDDDVGAFLCPLEHESIEKQLMVWTRSKTIPEEEQCAEIVNSVVREYFWYGKDIFEIKRKMLKEMLLEVTGELWIKPTTFPSWEELKTQFWNASRVEHSFESQE